MPEPVFRGPDDRDYFQRAVETKPRPGEGDIVAWLEAIAAGRDRVDASPVEVPPRPPSPERMHFGPGADDDSV